MGLTEKKYQAFYIISYDNQLPGRRNHKENQ